MLANWISISRFPLLLLNILILYLGTPAIRLAGVVLLLVGLMRSLRRYWGTPAPTSP